MLWVRCPRQSFKSPWSQISNQTFQSNLSIYKLPVGTRVCLDGGSESSSSVASRLRNCDKSGSFRLNVHLQGKIPKAQGVFNLADKDTLAKTLLLSIRSLTYAILFENLKSTHRLMQNMPRYAFSQPTHF